MNTQMNTQELDVDETEVESPLVDDNAAASLAALQAGAIAEPDAATEQAAAVNLEDAKAESALCVTLLAEGLSAKFPCLVYDEKTRETVASKLAPVMLKYGLNSEWFARFGAEIELASVVIVLGFQSWKLVKEMNLEAKIAAAVDVTPK